jgi:hypothetical protein
MKIKVISRGRKNGIDTAEIVVVNNGKSQTHHVWGDQTSGQYANVFGVTFSLK